jgi:hypothetical protein
MSSRKAQVTQQGKVAETAIDPVRGEWQISPESGGFQALDAFCIRMLLVDLTVVVRIGAPVRSVVAEF